MDIANLIESFADFAKQKNIDRPTMIRILEDVFRTMIKKKYVNDDNFDIIINDIFLLYHSAEYILQDSDHGGPVNVFLFGEVRKRLN